LTPSAPAARSLAAPRYRVVLARREHLPRLARIERAAAVQFPAHLLPPAVRVGVLPHDVLEAAQAQGRLWVALEPRGRCIGFAVAVPAGRDAFLLELDVLPGHQRRGLGRALIDALAAWAEAAGYARVTLTTFADVPWNAAFYRRAGFRRLEEDELDEYLSQRLAAERRHGLRDRVAMALPLGASGPRRSTAGRRLATSGTTSGGATVEVQGATPGTTRRVGVQKYAAMRAALLTVLPEQGPGLTAAELRAAVVGHLPPRLWPGGAAVGWWLRTVRRDLEARGLVERGVTAAAPRWRRVAR
jgi:GNAT superfamily N-acetyltransferase